MLILATLGTRVCTAQSWQDLGNTNRSSPYANVNLASDNQSIYLSYTNGSLNGRVSVMEYDGTFWNQIGDSCFSYGEPYNSEILAVSNGVPYLVTQDSLQRIRVMAYNGTDWVQLGESLSEGTGGASSIASEQGTLYVAYYDSNEGGVSLKYYNGTQWEPIGSLGFTSGETNYVSLAIDNGTPYIATQESTQLSVYSFDGNNWNALGQSISTAYASNIHIVMDSNHVFVSYEDQTSGCALRVIEYENGLFSPLGLSSFPYVPGLYSSLAVCEGIPVVSYREVTGELSVIAYMDGLWQYQGAPNISGGICTHADLLAIGTTLYVGYRDVDNGNTIHVKKLESSLSTHDIDSGEVTLSPNPSSGVIVIQSSAPILAIRIRDSKGSLVSTTTMPTADIRALSSGVYIVEIETQEGTVTKRFIKE